MATKYAQSLTPVGTFVFPALNPGQPDNFMNTEKYKTDLKMPADAEGLMELKIKADEVLEGFMQENGLAKNDWDIKPLVMDASWVDRETGETRDDGMVRLRADMKAKYIRGDTLVKNTPTRVDHNGDPLADDVDIAAGDVGRLMVAIKPYEYKDKGFVGVRLMLLGVQLIRKNAASGGSVSFGQIEPEDFIE